MLEETSKNVFVPLTIGGGIRNYTDSQGKTYTALDVAARYFRSGADKISIGSDAVDIAMAYLASGEKTGKSAIEEISRVYGNQAVVISVDPKRVYVSSPDEAPGHTVIKADTPGPGGEEFCCGTSARCRADVWPEILMPQRWPKPVKRWEPAKSCSTALIKTAPIPGST